MNVKRKYDTPILNRKKMKEVEYLTFPLLEKEEGIRHLFSTRVGGVSEGIFSSMNLSYTRGDDKAAVDENFRRIGEVLGLPSEHFVLSDQTHTTNVKIVTKEDLGKGVTCPKDYTDIDGLITNESGIILGTFYADCVPLYFYDPVKKVIALSHSGWRGTVAGMGRVTIEKMHAEFGCNPKDIRVCVGPSICQDCYEVSEDVAEEFAKAFPDKENEILLAKANQKYQLDLWKANEILLLDAGIKKEHLQITDICTCCNPEYLFSHRASQGKRGNLGAFLVLN